jgi:hypothetical protein
MEHLPLYLKAVLALFITFVLPGLLVVRMLKISELPLRWFAVFLGSLTVNHLAVIITALLGVTPTAVYTSMITCIVVAMIVLEVRRPNFASTASEARSSDVLWLLFSASAIAAIYFEIWQHGLPSAFDESDVSINWYGRWTLAWAAGLFPVGSGGYPQFVPTIWAVAYIVTGSQMQYFAFYGYVILIAAPLALSAMVLGRLRWWLPLVQFSVFAWFVAGTTDPDWRYTLWEAYPDWIVVVFSFTGVTLFLSQQPPHQRSFRILLLALCLECVAAATKPALGLFVVAFVLAICVDAFRHAEDRKLRICVILSVVGLVALFGMAYRITLMHIGYYGLADYYNAVQHERLARAWQVFSLAFPLPFRILSLSGLFLSPFLPRARWLTLPLLVNAWIWTDRASYDLRNCAPLILIAAVIPVDALARRFLKSDVAAFGRKWALGDATGAICALVALILFSLPIAKEDSRLEAQFADEQLRLGPGRVHNEAIASALRAGCALFTTTQYPMTVVAWQPYRSQIHFFYRSYPIGRDDSGTEREAVRVYAEDLQRAFENVTGCATVIFLPALARASALTFLHGYFQRHNLRKVVDASGMELWSSLQESR